MSLTSGSHLGPYEVVAPLGAGGMGEVYRARDTKLNRDVAIKVLPAAFAQDSERMARFQREAQVLAALNHPNIAAIHGMEESALIMEFVPGDNLRGPLPLDEAMVIARQIAEALEAAHEKGIVHRDLKPANIKLTPEGKVKVLDFGLAKAMVDESADLSNSPTLSIAATRAGVIMGTASYMSPEQAKGKRVDGRADIWAYGCVLYELLTGKQAFPGETAMDAMAAIINKEPDWSLLPAGSPLELLRACLQKDVNQRLRHIGDSALITGMSTMQQTLVLPAVPGIAPDAGTGRPLIHWIAYGVLALALIATGIIAWRATRPAPLRPLMRLNVEVGPDASLARVRSNAILALSPDGTRLVVTYKGPDGKPRLGTRLLHQNTITPLSNTEDATSPFFSPDGQWIAFATDNKLKKISVDGGAAVTICEVLALRGGSWGDDGRIVLAVSQGSALSRVSSDGGKLEPVTKLAEGERSHRWLQVLPGSQAILFTSSHAAGDYDEADIEVFSVKTGQRKIVQRGGFSARYLKSGHLVYLHQSTLFAAPFDLNSLALTGPPAPILEDVGSTTVAGGDFAFSNTGSFIYLPGQSANGGSSLFWLDSTGKRQVLHAPVNVYLMPRFSPDGKRLAVSMRVSGSVDIWVKELERDTLSRLTFTPGENTYPVWTPDGRAIVFRNNGKNSGMYWIRSDGSGEAQRLTEGKDDTPYSLSPDGRRLAYYGTGANGSQDIWTAPLEGDSAHPKLGKGELFLGTQFTELSPAFSPDGHWLAYVSTESGAPEIYVRPFPGPGGRRQISTDGGIFPVWSRSGHDLLFEKPSGEGLMAVSYEAKGETFTASAPRVWSKEKLIATTAASYDLAPDGKRIAAMLGDDSAQTDKPATHLIFLLNFFDELRRKSPGKN